MQHGEQLRVFSKALEFKYLNIILYLMKNTYFALAAFDLIN